MGVGGILTFGTVSKMFSNLKLNLRKAIASSNDYQARYREQVYTNNLQIVCNLRNICAHHGRLYGSLYPYNVLISNNDMMLFSRFGFPIPNNSTSNLFYLIFALCNLMMCEKDKKLFVKRLRLLFFKYRKYIDLNKIGFAKNWAKLLLKNK